MGKYRFLINAIQDLAKFNPEDEEQVKEVILYLSKTEGKTEEEIVELLKIFDQIATDCAWLSNVSKGMLSTSIQDGELKFKLTYTGRDHVGLLSP